MKKITFEIALTDTGKVTLEMHEDEGEFNVAEVLGMLELAKQLVVEEGE